MASTVARTDWLMVSMAPPTTTQRYWLQFCNAHRLEPEWLEEEAEIHLLGTNRTTIIYGCLPVQSVDNLVDKSWWWFHCTVQLAVVASDTVTYNHLCPCIYRETEVHVEYTTSNEIALSHLTWLDLIVTGIPKNQPLKQPLKYVG